MLDEALLSSSQGGVEAWESGWKEPLEATGFENDRLAEAILVDLD